MWDHLLECEEISFLIYAIKWDENSSKKLYIKINRINSQTVSVWITIWISFSDGFLTHIKWEFYETAFDSLGINRNRNGVIRFELSA